MAGYSQKVTNKKTRRDDTRPAQCEDDGEARAYFLSNQAAHTPFKTDSQGHATDESPDLVVAW